MDIIIKVKIVIIIILIIAAIIIVIIISYNIFKICGISKNPVVNKCGKNITEKNAVTTLNELVL